MSRLARRRRWTNWLTRKLLPIRKVLPLRVEELEVRTTPASFQWSGAGTDNNWSTGANWVGGIAPTGTPAAGDELVFPAGAARLGPVDDIASGTFNSITVSGAGYTLNATAGNKMTLGQSGVLGSGTFVVNAGASATLAIDTTLGAASGSDQTFRVGSGGTLTVNSKLSGTTGATLTKDGVGVLTLANDNSGFTGSIRTVNAGGTLIISHPLALGSTSAPTTVSTNSTLQIVNAAGMTINEPLVLNGLGVANDGALNNVTGNNVWAGKITLDTDAAIGASSGVLSITSVISDTGAGHNLTKEGPGEVQFNSPSGNTYRGLTTINHGVLTITHPLALGAAGTPANGTVVNEDLTRAGRLQISDPSGNGFIILNEQLTLNGDGQVGSGTNNDKGALRNAKGDNQWAGPVILGSPAPTVVGHANIGVAAGTNFTISGVVSSPNQDYTLRKRETGRLIFNNANTYTGQTLIQQGIITIRDSQGLGTTGPFDDTIVSNGSALELEVEAAKDPNGVNRFDPQGRDLWNDSVTHDAHRLWVSEPLTITGRGLNNTGALRSISGINEYLVGISLTGGEAAIGVDPDQRPGHPTPDNTYFVSDYSLTTKGNISGVRTTDFIKRNTGHLIFPRSNSYLGDTHIEQGWITIEDENALGGRISSVGDTVQPPTFVENGAALHIRPLFDGAPAMTIPENITLEGVGIDHPYAFIGKKGALMNLGGDNTWRGDITLTGQVGIGVEQLPNFSSSDLLVTGSMKEGGSSQIFSFQASGGEEEFAQVIDTGATTGTVTIDYDMLIVTDSLKVYYPPRAAGGTAIIDTGFVSGQNTVSAPFGPGASTQIEIVVNEGGTPGTGTLWFLDRVEVQTAKAGGGFLKYGSKRLRLQGDGTYKGNSDVIEGTVLVENDTGLGRFSSGTLSSSEVYSETDTRVSTGAVLQLDASIAERNGGIVAGLQIWDERLLLNSPGQQIAVAGAVDPLVGRYKLSYNDGSTTTTTRDLFITATPQEVRDAINQDLTNLPAGISAVVTQTGNVYTVVFNHALGVARAPNVNLLQVAALFDGAEVTIAGSDAQVVNLSHDNTWRGPVLLESHARVFVSPNSRLNLLGTISDKPTDPVGADFVKRGTGELAIGGANSYRGVTGIDEGIVNAMNSSAFGATTNGTVVADGAQLQIQGNLTIAGEPLTIQGTGPAVTPVYDERWLNTGAATTNNGTSGANLPTSGRITSVATDPSDPNVIYIAAAGGGVWKSKNGGITWLNLFDETIDPQAALYGGSVAVAPSNPHTIYFATGETNGRENGQPIAHQTDNYAGTGVYRSSDDGRTWTLLSNPDGSNPLYGQAISKLIVDPENASRIYVASGTSNVINADPSAVPGVYRYDGSWTNLTGNPSPARLGTPASVSVDITAGPDDDFRIAFPKSNATWSDLLLVKRGVLPSSGKSEWVLYAALGEVLDSSGSNGQKYYAGAGAGGQAILDGVYRTEDPDIAAGNPTWWLGQGTAYVRAVAEGPAIPSPLPPLPMATQPDGRGGGFPVGPVTPPSPFVPPGRNGWIKLGGAVQNFVQSNGTTTNYYTFNINNAHITVYASIARPIWDPLYGELLDIQKSGWDGGINTNWGATASVPSQPFGQATRANQSTFFDNLIPALGRYDHTLVVQDFDPRTNVLTDNDPNIVYLGGKDQLFRSTDGGTTWAAIPPDSNGIYPSHGFHALHLDTSNRLLTGSDGGIWRMNTSSLGFQDLNANLSITQYNSVDPHPTNFLQAYGGAQDNGTQAFNGSESWFRVDDTTGLNTGVIRYDPSNPSIAYAVRDGVLRKTTNAGATWTTILNVTDTNVAFTGLNRSLATNYFPLIVDNINPNRILVGGGGNLLGTSGSLRESILGGTPGSFIDLNPGISPTSIGVASFQGPFVPDPSFVNVTDKLTNTYDPDTIYVTNGTTVRLTKNHGVTWTSRTPTFTRSRFTIDFDGFLKYKDVPQMTVMTSPGVYATVRTDVNGNPFFGDKQTLDVVALGGTAGTFTLNFTYQTTTVSVTEPVSVSGAQLKADIDAALMGLVGGEIQDITITPTGASPMFTLTYGGAGGGTTPARAPGTAASVIQADLEALTALTGNVIVTSIANGYRVQFIGGLGGMDITLGLTATGTNARVLVQEVQRGGLAFVNVTAPSAKAPIFTDLVVDPSNRDVVYLAARYPDGQHGPTVLRSTDAGRSWTDISGNLEGLQTWKIVVDPRDDSAYIGNDDGVFKLDNAGSVLTPGGPASAVWGRYGDGMPHNQVRDLVLNQGLNTLTAATYGRGMQQLFLTDYESASGALRIVSGSSVWTGPITLVGDTTIGVAGTQALQNGIAAASLNIIGTISDDTPGANHQLVKIGAGTVTLSGTNTYGGQTQVLEGVLQVNNPNALGAATPTGNTIVLPTSINGRPPLAALELRSNLEAEPITINGRGYLFNNHFTGALRNVSNDNTYTGPLTFGTDTTIGVDSNTSLTIGELLGLSGEGTITDAPFGFDKESPGTLVLASANQYDGLTLVRQGALRVEHEFALGDTTAGTRVLDGAQVQISRRLDVNGNTVTPVETVVSGEPLSLSGTGIFGTGALLNVRGDSDPTGTNNNKWQGPITFTIDPNDFPPTNPGSQIAMGVSDSRDILTIDTTIFEDNAPFKVQYGLIKVGPGVLALSKPNQYTGVTNVNEGSLRVQHDAALGPPVSSEVQTLSVFGTTIPGTRFYTLRFPGLGAPGTGPVTTSIDATATALQVQQRLEALSNIAPGDVQVSETLNANGKVYHITFGGAYANTNVAQLEVAGASAGLSVSVTTPQQGGTGTIVANGASLEIDGSLTALNVNEVLSLNGDGVNGAGALNNVANTNIYSGPVTLATNTSIGAVANTQLIVTGVVQDPSPSPVPAARLRKAGDGVVTFPDAKPYGGFTDIAQGVLRIGDPLSLGTIRNEMQTIQVNATGGTLRLTFDGQQTALLIYNAAANPVSGYTAAQIEAALEALPNIDDVSVTQANFAGGNLFTVTFLGNQGNRNVPQLMATTTGATNAVVTTVQDGQEGTVVRSGATLQISGPIVMTSESVTINGPGFNNQGALNNYAGDNIWASQLILGSNASIGTTNSTDDLTFTLPITDANPATGVTQGFNLDVVGPGTVHFDATGDNQYTGTTWAKQGTLLLNHTGGRAILGPLVVGDGSAIPAIVRELQPNEVADTSPVTVNSNGTFDLNSLVDTIDKLTVNGGLVLTGAGGKLTTADVAMTGGTITVGDGGTLDSKNVTTDGGLIQIGVGSKVTALDVGMTNGAEITIANTGELHAGDVTMDASKITAQDNVIVAIGDLGMSGGSDITIGTTGHLTAGTVAMDDSTLSLGTGSMATVLDIGMKNGSSISLGDGGTIDAKNLTMDASSITAGNNTSVTVGTVGMTGASSIAVGGTSKLTTSDVTMAGKSAITVGGSGQMMAGNLSLDDSSITLDPGTTATVLGIDMKNGSAIGLGDGGKLSGGDLTMDASSFTAGIGTTVTVLAANMSGGSKVTVGDSGQVTTGNIGMTGKSSITIGSTSNVLAGALNLDDSSISFGQGTTATVLGIDMKNGSAISVGMNGQLDADNVTMASSMLTVGDSGHLTTDDVVMTDSMVSLGVGSNSTVGNVNQTGGSISLGATGHLTALNVTVDGGLITVGIGATANTQAFDLTGSTIDLDAGSFLFLGGNVSGTSDATASSFINGPGTLHLNGATRTFTVANGPKDRDLVVSAALGTTGTEGIIKASAGRLVFTGTAFLNETDILGGDVEVDSTATLGPVEIDGGSLSGTGVVGTIDGPGAGTAVNGSVSPGINYAANPAGILTSQSVVLGPSSTFEVDIAHTSGSMIPLAGSDYDRLDVNGDIELGGAALKGLVGDGIQLGDRYTIIQTSGGTVSGKFATPYGPDVIFVAGFKFTIDYSDPTKVDLVKVLADTTTTISSSVNPSTINQPVTFTATVIPEQGVIDTTPMGQPLVVGTVTFFIDGNNSFTATVDASGHAVYLVDPSNPPLTGGMHTVTATYNGDPDLLDMSSSSPLTQIVEVPFIDTLVGGPGFISPNNSPGIQDTFDVSTTVHEERSMTTWTVNVRDAGNSIVRTITGVIDPMTGNTFPINASWDGRDNNGDFVADGSYTVTATFLDQWGNTATTPALTVVVDNTSPTADAVVSEHPVIAPGTASTVFETTTLTSTVGDDNLTGWTVTIFNSLNNPVRSINGTGTAVSVIWDGRNDGGTIVSDGEYTASVKATDAAGNSTTSAPANIVVLTVGPTITLDSNTPTVYGSDINLTTTVSVPFASVNDLLDGDTVEFFLGTTSLGTSNLSLVGGQFQASLTVPMVLNAGTYTNFTAKYLGTEDFLESTSAPHTHVVTPAPLTVVADNKTKVYGDPIPPLTFQATGFVAGDTAAEVLSGNLATPATPSSGVGTYPILQGSLASNQNYTITFTPGTLTITPAALTIQIDNKERPLFSPNPPLTATFIGLVAGDTSAVVSNLNLTTTANSNSPLGDYPITASGTPTAANYTIQVIPGVLTVTPIPTSFAIGSGPGATGLVNFYTPDSSLAVTDSPFGDFRGGMRVATGDFNRDGVEDLAVGTGPGAQARVLVVSGRDGSQLFSIFPFEDFTGGVFVAAGDITGDGVAELIITPDEGGGPRVSIRHGGDFAPLVDYFGINDPNFRGGVRAGVGDMNADGFGDVVISAGFGGGPRISIWDGKYLSAVQFRNIMPDFFVFDPSLRNGAFVSVGDVNGDGLGDLIAGAGPGGAPHIKIFSGHDLLTAGPLATQPFATFFAGDPENRGGVHVAAKDLDGDKLIDVLTGPGDSNDVVTAYRGSSLAQSSNDVLFTIDPFGGVLDGVFVG